MRSIYASCILLFGFFSSRAQSQSMEIGDPGSVGGNYGTVRYYDPSTIGQKGAPLSYADISGSPFWDDKWKPAFLFLRAGNTLKLKNVKLNLYTNDVHYLDNDGKEWAAETGSVQKLILLNEKDTNRIASVFEAFADIKDKSKIAYYKVLNNGKFRLLEMRRSYINTSQYDALQGKSVSSFFLKSSYAITDSISTQPVKALNRNNILPLVYPAYGLEQWLLQSGNKLNTEKEVIAFLDYVNSRKK